MKYQLLNKNDPQISAVIFKSGDKVVSGLKEIAGKYNLNDSQITAIGAFSYLELAYFDVNDKEYRKTEISEQVEVVSFLGNISTYKEEKKIHIHASAARKDLSVIGGHLIEAVANPTLEVIITSTPGYLKREYNEKFGIPLIVLNKEN